MIRAFIAATLLALPFSAAGAQELQLNVIQESLDLRKSDAVAAEAVLQEGRWIVEIQFSHAASVKFGEITGRNVRKRMQIVVGDRIVSTAMIMTPITGGAIVITGNFSEAEAKEIAAKLK